MLRHPYLLFVGDAGDQLAAKTALGIAVAARLVRRAEQAARLPRPPGPAGDDPGAGRGRRRGHGGRRRRQRRRRHPAELDRNARPGSRAGLDLASGLHDRLSDIPRLRDIAVRLRPGPARCQASGSRVQCRHRRAAARQAAADGRHRLLDRQDVIVGCMVATSLGIAPRHAARRHAQVVDLDGPLWLAHDRGPSLRFAAGWIDPPIRRCGGSPMIASPYRTSFLRH